MNTDPKSNWLLDPAIAFLNHGSFGALPRLVFGVQEAWRRRIETEPVEIIARQCSQLLDETKHAIGQWLGMDAADFGMVCNATEGINAVLQSLRLTSADELLTTNHVYNAVRQAMRYVCNRSGATYRELKIPLPVADTNDVYNLVAAELSERTRLLVIDHVTSPTALIFPAERIASECARRGIEVLVDGAHAPGMLDLNVPAVGATYYAGNLHKWACAPRGSAFLWVRRDRQPQIHPLIVSHHYGTGFAKEFGWQGTRDLSAWFAVPDALRFMSALGWDNVRRYNHEMIVWANEMLCRRWGVHSIGPADGSLFGSMCTVSLPGSLSRLSEEAAMKLQIRLYREHQVEAPLVCWEGGSYVRPCCQVYNSREDFERLAEGINSFLD